MKQQIKGIAPSVPDALFRLLMREPTLSYLRDQNKIIGFEICEDSRLLSGYVLIALKKQTILAYKSDIKDKEQRLILFPTLDKLFDDEFELLGLTAKKVLISNDSFTGKVLDEGLIRNLVTDLTPPFKKVDLSESELNDVNTVFSQNEHSEYIDEPEFIDEPDFVDEPDFGEPFELSKSDKLMSQTFSSLDELTRFLVIELSVSNEIVDKVINNVLHQYGHQMTNEQLITTMQRIFKRAFDENKIT